MTKQFKEVLLHISQLPMHQQNTYLHDTIMSWMETGNTSQTDDITVIGLNTPITY